VTKKSFTAPQGLGAYPSLCNGNAESLIGSAPLLQGKPKWSKSALSALPIP